MKTFFVTLLLVLFHAAIARNWCGTVAGNAVKCETECPGATDGECPAGESCYADIVCGKRDDAYCGSSFAEAHTCKKRCIGGTDEECGGAKCFGDVQCGLTNQNRCGNSWDDAAATCGKTCPAGLDDECGGSQNCYAKTGCPVNIPTDPDTADPDNGNMCFSAEATVEVKEKGIVAMKNLQVGDLVLTRTSSGVGYEKVYAFGHKDTHKTSLFLQVHTDSSASPLEISPKHLVYVRGKENPITADSLKVGDVLFGLHQESAAVIHKITTAIRHDGVYAPFTPSGNVLVNGYLASNYVSLQKHSQGMGMGDEYPQLADGVLSLPWSQHACLHMALSPLRLLCVGISPSLCSNYMQDGKPLMVGAGMKLAGFAQENDNFYLQLFLCLLVILVCFPIYVLEILITGSQFGLPVLLGGVTACIVWFPRATRASCDY